MLTKILAAALTSDQQKAGCYLVELDDHELHLMHGCTLVAQYYATNVTVAQIRWDAARYMMEAVIADLGRMARQ